MKNETNAFTQGLFKCRAILAAAVVLMILTSCVPDEGRISSVQMLYQLTGNHQEAREMSPWPKLINNTGTLNIYGADLGVLWYSSYYDYVFFAFGDTFGPDRPDGKYRNRVASNFLAATFDPDITDGIAIPGYFMDTNSPNELVPVLSDNESAIPTSGLASDNSARQYIWIMDVDSWDPWTASGSRLVYTDDYYISHNTGVTFPGNSFFVMSYMLRVGSDVYIYGTKAARVDGVKIAKVPYSQLTNKSAYRYFTGGTSWSTSESAAIKVIDSQQVGELSVMWNAYLGKYMMLFFSRQGGPRVRMRLADNPWGPWNNQEDVVACGDAAHPEYRNCYGSYMIPQYTENNGKVVYFIMSRMTGTAYLGDCYQTSPPSPCNKVYNTFQMKLTFK